MTVIERPIMRAAFCSACALPTGELYPQDEAPTVAFCNNCENLPAPWYCDHDGTTAIGPERRNRNENPDEAPLMDRYETRLRRERLGVGVTPAARPADAIEINGLRNVITQVGPARDAQGRFAARVDAEPPEPVAPTIPTCECGSHRFYADVAQEVRVRRFGDSPTYNCGENEPGDMVVGVDCCIDGGYNDEQDLDTYDTEVQRVVCADCGNTWQGEWEPI